MAKWNDKKSISVTFDVKPNEQMDEFVASSIKELKNREDVFRKRIKQLFDEYIEIDGDKKDETYRKILNVFSIGYQHGWNDYYRTQEVADQARINEATIKKGCS